MKPKLMQPILTTDFFSPGIRFAAALFILSLASFSARSQTPLSLRAQATPAVVTANQVSRITVVAQLSQAKALPSSMVLYRMSAGGKQAIAQLSPQNGSRTTYVAQVTLKEGNVGRVVLQVEGQYQSTGVYMARAANPQLDSNLVTIDVVGQRQQPGQTWPGQPGQPPISNSGGSNGSAWGSFVGNLLGSVLNKHDSQPQSPDQQPPIQPPSVQPQPVQPSNPRPQNPQYADTPLQAKGLSIKCPAGWNVSQQILQMGGPIALKNFPSYLQGGIIPGGGAEIEITTTPATGVSVEDTVQQELGPTGVPQYVDGRAAVRINYVDEFTPALSYESVAVYVAEGGLLYKFFLSYRAGDQRRDAFLGSFDHVLETARFQN